MDRRLTIETTLRTHFAPEQLTVVDESDRHAGHVGAKEGGHFRVLIVSAAFLGQTHLQRQRSVYAALAEAMRTEVHALALRALTPEEWIRSADLPRR